MSNVLGLGTSFGENPVWDGTKWENISPNVPMENGRAGRQLVGWPVVGNRRSFTALSASVPTVAGSVYTACCFDGRDLWVCDEGTTPALLKYDFIGGQRLQSVSSATLGFGVSPPSSLAYDGEHVYVGSVGAGEVVQLTTSGVVVDTLSLSGVRFLLYDGEKVWGFCDTTIVRIDDIGVPTVTTVSGFTQARKGVFDGLHLWVLDSSALTLHRIDPYPATPVVKNTYTLTAGGTPTDITFDGASLWIADSTLRVIYRVHARTGYLESFSVSAQFLAGSPQSIGFDGRLIYATGGSRTVRYNPTTARPIDNVSDNFPPHGVGASGYVLPVDNGFVMTSGAGNIMRGTRGFTTGMFANAVKIRNSFVPVQSLWLSYNLGSVGGVASLPSAYSKARVLELTGTLTSNLRIEPQISTYWVLENNMTLGGNTLTFGNSVSSVDLGANGTKSIVWLDGTITAGTFRLANQYV